MFFLRAKSGLIAEANARVNLLRAEGAMQSDVRQNRDRCEANLLGTVEGHTGLPFSILKTALASSGMFRYVQVLRGLDPRVFLGP